MNLDALPYTSFIVLLEFCVGSLLVCMLADWRGSVTSGFLKLSAAMVAIGALVLLLNVLVLDPKSAIGGYRLEDGVLPWVKVATVVFLGTTLPYFWFMSSGDKRRSMQSGFVALAATFLAIFFVPLFFVLIQKVSHRLTGGKRQQPVVLPAPAQAEEEEYQHA